MINLKNTQICIKWQISRVGCTADNKHSGDQEFNSLFVNKRTIFV